MTNASMTFGRPSRLNIPRGALWFGTGAAMLIEGLRRLDRWQLSVGHRDSQSANDVMAWADRIEASEPSFAADLRAAAVRSLDDSAR